MDLSFFNLLHPAMWIKIVTLIAISFYIIFTFVVFTQVRVMGEIVFMPVSKTAIKTISVIHIILAISLFIIAVVIL